MLFFFFLLLTALQVGSPAAADGRLYVVGPSDVLAVTVFNQPQLSGMYAVEADGAFTFPLLGRVVVTGLSVRAIEDDMRDRLGRGYLKDPQVRITVDEYRSQQVFVMGEVRQPGSLQFTGSMTLIEALARVGSTTDRAGLEAVIVRRPEGGAPAAADIERPQDIRNAEVIRVNLETLQRGTLSQNAALRGGDTIFVPRAETVFVSGQVRSAGEYVIRSATTIRQVLALAGGVTDRGSTRRIQIVRKVDGREATIGARLEDPVRAGDTIVVRERLL